MSLRPKYKGIILAPDKHVANSQVLNYWSEYFIIIRSYVLCALLKPLLYNKLTCYDVMKYCYGIDEQADIFNIQRQYLGREPLLSMKGCDYERGRNWLNDLGVPRDAWFVCLHCREDGYVDGENQSYRNGDINSYIPAIKTITDRGGWVIRMGGPTNKQIPSMERVIDYANLNSKNNWIDIFLCAACKFFIGTSSGLCAVSHVFGVPVVSTNAAPMSMMFGYRSDDLSIPKLVWSYKYKRLLSFHEVFDSDISNFRFDNLFYEANVKVVDNDPEDIKQVVLEMMDSLEGNVIYTAEDEQLQSSYKSMMKSVHYSYGTVARIGKDFLRKYAFLFESTEARP